MHTPKKVLDRNAEACSIQNASPDDIVCPGATEQLAASQSRGCRLVLPWSSRTGQSLSILVTGENTKAILGLSDSGLEELSQGGELTVVSICGKRRYLRHEVQSLVVHERAA
jgi:hypothetical protein